MPIAITIAEELQRIESHLSFDMDATVAHFQNQNTIQLCNKLPFTHKIQAA